MHHNFEEFCGPMFQNNFAKCFIVPPLKEREKKSGLVLYLPLQFV